MTRNERKTYIKQFYIPIIYGELDKLVDQVYDEDIGTCGECKYADTRRQCPVDDEFFGFLDKNKFFCADFEREEND